MQKCTEFVFSARGLTVTFAFRNEKASGRIMNLQFIDAVKNLASFPENDSLLWKAKKLGGLQGAAWLLTGVQLSGPWMDRSVAAYSAASASAWVGKSVAYLGMPTIVNTLVKCAERPQTETFCPAVAASISSWMTRAMPLELM